MASAILGARLTAADGLIAEYRPGDVVTFLEEEPVTATTKSARMLRKSANAYSRVTTIIGMDPAKWRDLMTTVVVVNASACVMAWTDPHVAISLVVPEILGLRRQTTMDRSL